MTYQDKNYIFHSGESAIHRIQNLVISRLHWQMKMIDQLWQTPVGVDQIFAEPDRVWRSEAKALQAINLMDGVEQLHKRTFVVDLRKFVAAVEVYDLTEYRYFGHAVGNLCADVADSLVNRAAALGAACLRHNAKRAVHVAALHDRDERGCLLRRELLIANRRLRSRFLIDVHDRETRIVHSACSFPFQCVVYIIRDAMKLSRPNDKIDMWQICQQRSSARLCHAAEKTK